MVVQVSPEAGDSQESVCSIAFGQRARNVELGGGVGGARARGKGGPAQAAQMAASLGVKLVVLRVPGTRSPLATRQAAGQLLEDLVGRTGGYLIDTPLDERATETLLLELGAPPKGLMERVWMLPWRNALTMMALACAGIALWREKCGG